VHSGPRLPLDTRPSSLSNRLRLARISWVVFPFAIVRFDRPIIHEMWQVQLCEWQWTENLHTIASTNDPFEMRAWKSAMSISIDQIIQNCECRSKTGKRACDISLPDRTINHWEHNWPTRDIAWRLFDFIGSQEIKYVSWFQRNSWKLENV
jgi:hypothetical protein